MGLQCISWSVCGDCTLSRRTDQCRACGDARTSSGTVFSVVYLEINKEKQNYKITFNLSFAILIRIKNSHTKPLFPLTTD
jgi:hypothetical protein